MMKRLLAISTVLFGISTTIESKNCCSCKTSAHSVFTVRPLYQVDSPEYRAGFYDRMNAREDGIEGALQITAFGGQSLKRKRLATFFTPFCQSTLNVKEVQDADTDILASNFNILLSASEVIPPFESIISFCPRQSTVGVGISYEQSFLRRDDDSYFWVCFSTPLTHIRNTMGFTEHIINPGGAVEVAPDGDIQPVANMTQAFAQSSWNFGNIFGHCSRDTTRLGDITLELGYEGLKRDTYHADAHVGVIIPTGNSVRSKTVFEPIIGRNKHFGAIMGSDMGVEFLHNECKDRKLWGELSMQGVIMFCKRECRLIDVKCKPWSRYMPVYRDLGQAQLAAATEDAFLFTPGVNVFGQSVRVFPGLQRTYNSALIFTNACFEVEGGYNYYSRAPECVKLCNTWPATAAFKATRGAGFTNSLLNISGGFFDPQVPVAVHDKDVSLYGQNVILESDLDLANAGHPAMITHTAYVAASYRWDDRDFPVFINGGGSYEFSEDNTGMDRWTLWVKSGVSF